MRIKKWVGVLGVVVGLLGAGVVRGDDLPRGAVHRISTEGGWGSGVMVRKGLMVSAWHVVEGERIGNVMVQVGREWRKVEKLTKIGDSDLVLIETNVECPCAEVAEAGDFTGAEMVSVGYPFQSQLAGHLFVYRGEIVGGVMGSRYVASTAIVMPGMSGGGMFVKVGERWKLLGVVYGVLSIDGMGLQNWVSLMTVVPKGVL